MSKNIDIVIISIISDDNFISSAKLSIDVLFSLVGESKEFVRDMVILQQLQSQNEQLIEFISMYIMKTTQGVV
jgi:hypothetical protein